MRAPIVGYRCPLAWDSLPGDGARRSCAKCGETVTNLSAMNPAAARRFVDEHPNACIRFAADSRGRVVFQRRRFAVIATAAALTACASWQEADEVAAPPDPIASARDDATIPDALEAADVPHDPDPPELHREPRPVPQLTRRELREIRRVRLLRRHRVMMTMGR